MSQLRKFLNNTLAISIAKGLQPIFNFVLSLAIGRLLGVKIFGAYATIFFILTIFQMLSSLGLKPYLTREVAKDRQSVSRYFTNGLILIFPISIINLFVMIEIVKMLRYEAVVVAPIMILSFSLVASGIADCLESILEGLQKIQAIAAVWLLEQFLRVLFSVIAIYSGYGLNEICVIFVIMRILNPILLYLVLLKEIAPVHWQPDYETIKELIKSVKTFGPILISVAFYWQLDSILMSKILGLEEVGIYNAAFRLFRFFIIFVQSFMIVFYPMASDLFANHSDKFEMICKKSIFYLLILLLPFVVTMSIFSTQLIQLLWGPKYSGSALVLQVLIWCILPYAISKIFAYALLASNLQRFDLRINIAGTIIKLVLLIIMMKMYGYLGAAIASLLAINIYVFLQLPFISKYLFKFHVGDIFRLGIKVVIALVSMIIVARLLMNINFICSVIVSNIVYVSALFMNKIFNNYDKTLFRQFAKLQ